MLKVLGLVTGALAAAAGMLAVTGVPRVAGVDWHASTNEQARTRPPADPTPVAPVVPARAVMDTTTPPPSAPAEAHPAGPDEPMMRSVEDADVVDAPAPEYLLASNGVAPAPVAAPAVPATPAESAPEPSDREEIVGGANSVPGNTDTLDDAPSTPASVDDAGVADQDLAAPETPIDASVADLFGPQPGPVEAPMAAWHPVWAPFRSELSARGFMQRLERLTDLSYRVSKVGPGLYQVAFAHADAGDRATGIAAIEKATGLSLAETRP